MPPEQNAAEPSNSGVDDLGYSTSINGVIGGVAGIFLSFIPFAPVLGGAIAGYLEGGQPKDGVRPGAIAGVIMFIPTVLIGGFFLLLFGFFSLSELSVAVSFVVIGGVILLFSALYTIGLSVVGGYLGVYVKNEL